MKINKRNFDVKKHTYIMGILNVTPDSFSDGGRWNQKDEALAHVETMIQEGADIIDVGGESTRPGYTFLMDEEEISRVVPIIREIKARFDIPISIDTYKSKVAKAAIEAGADMVNDIWGLKFDKEMAGVIAKYQIPCCLMHNRKEPDYENFMDDMIRDLRESVAIAKAAGIKDENLILDPGVGFGKAYENNLEAIYRLECLHELGLPILLGTSRKSVIGLTLQLPAAQRLEGTLATTVLGVMKRAAFVRVHDIKENARTIQMTEAMMGNDRFLR